MSEPQATPRSIKQTVIWPVTVNLLLVLVVTLVFNLDTGAFFGFFLALLNGLIGFVLLLVERRRDAGYAGGFFLSCLLLFIIGFGMCSHSGDRHRVEFKQEPVAK